MARANEVSILKRLQKAGVAEAQLARAAAAGKTRMVPMDKRYYTIN